ncbi:hypothetical protein ACEWY4_005594 [Coilia grayii]|uniref:Myb-like domain-containing protein n=1 Tax=Coilia grayii TaxID=363190 RepID=A0ABD1KIY3_9TELE
MFLSPSKCNVYRANDPPGYGRLSRHPTPMNVYPSGKDSPKPKGNCHNGDRQPSLVSETLRGKTVLNSTAREDASPDFSCGLSYIGQNGRALCGDAFNYSSVSALKAAEFRQWESPVKVFARMKAKVSNQNTPRKSSVVREDLPPLHGFVQPHVNLQTMDIEQHPSSMEDTGALTISPPNSPGRPSPPEVNSGELDEELQGVQYNVNVIGRLQDRCLVSLERLPVMHSPAKIFAMMKKTSDVRPLKPTLLEQTQENRENVLAVEPSVDTSMDENDHIPNEEGTACSDGSVSDSQSEGISPAALPKSATEKHPFVPPRVCNPTELPCMDDSMLFGSPRLAIPQKKRAADSGIKVNSENHDPRTVEGIQLKDWVLRLSDDKLFVDGKRVDIKIPWHSNTIVERIESNVLKTVSGRTYILIGKMSTKYSSNLPTRFRKKFLYGFPKMWETYLQTYLKESKGSGKHKPEKAFVPTKRKELPHTKTKPEELLSPQFSNAATPASSQGNSQKVSRSGRVIKPPLEYWRGGRVILDLDLNVTVFQDYSVIQTPTTTARKESLQKRSTKKSTAARKESCPSTSSQDEAGEKLVRKAKSYQRSVRQPSGDRVPSQTRAKSPFAVPQPREQLPSESAQSLPRRSSRRSASTSPLAGEDQASPGVGDAQNKAGAHGMGTKRCSRSRQRTRASSNAVNPKQTPCAETTDPRQHQGPRLRSKSRSSSEDGRQTRQKRSPPAVDSQASSAKNKNKKQAMMASEPVATVASPLPLDTEQEVMGPPKTKRRARGQKNKSLFVDDSAAEVFSDCASDCDSNSQRKRPSSKRGAKKVTTKELYDHNKWTDEELQKLHDAVRSASGSEPTYTPAFWVSVASKVGSRSPEECQEQYSGQKHTRPRAGKPKKKNGTKEETGKEIPQITSKVGTLKRMQQIRNVLAHLPKDGYDDAFFSSPLQKRRKKFTEGEEDDPLGQPLTPKTPTSGGFVGIETPKCLHISPTMFSSINRYSSAHTLCCSQPGLHKIMRWCYITLQTQVLKYNIHW